MTKPSRNIFISYAHTDRAFVNDLLSALDREGLKYWSDQDLRLGSKWMTEIEDAIRRSSVFLLVISPDFLDSDWGKFELGLAVSKAREKNALVLPIIAKPSHVPATVRRFSYIDAQSMAPQTLAEKVREAIDRAEANG